MNCSEWRERCKLETTNKAVRLSAARLGAAHIKATVPHHCTYVQTYTNSHASRKAPHSSVHLPVSRSLVLRSEQSIVVMAPNTTTELKLVFRRFRILSSWSFPLIRSKCIHHSRSNSQMVRSVARSVLRGSTSARKLNQKHKLRSEV